ARILYRSIGENPRDALLTCLTAMIEQALGKLDDAHKHLLATLQRWKPELDKLVDRPTPSKSNEQRVQEIANVISAVACSLASVELEAQNYLEALTYVHQARQAGQHSYILRRAEAEIMLGHILETIDIQDAAAEQAFRNA